VSVEEAESSHRSAWFRSSYSNGAGGECVECTLTTSLAVVRDSKWEEAGPVITVGSGAWLPFLVVLRSGRLDDAHLS
jgi:hypothetical protein